MYFKKCGLIGRRRGLRAAQRSFRISRRNRRIEAGEESCCPPMAVRISVHRAGAQKVLVARSEQLKKPGEDPAARLSQSCVKKYLCCLLAVVLHTQLRRHRVQTSSTVDSIHVIRTQLFFPSILDVGWGEISHGGSQQFLRGGPFRVTGILGPQH